MTLAVLGIIFMLFISVPSAFAAGDYCFEKTDGADPLCGMMDDPFGAMLKAYDPIFGDLTIALLWGILISVLWIRVQNTALVGIVGLVAAGAITGLSPEAYRVGIMLSVIAMGIMLFQLIQSRIKYPQ